VSCDPELGFEILEAEGYGEFLARRIFRRLLATREYD
jgi:hypothetical protein